METIIKTNIPNGSNEVKDAYLKGAEFVRQMVLKKMKELLDDEFLSDGQVLDELYEFIKK